MCDYRQFRRFFRPHILDREQGSPAWPPQSRTPSRPTYRQLRSAISPGSAIFHPSGWSANAPDLWATSWLVAEVACDVRDAAQFITFDVGAENMIIARGADGQLQEQKIQRGHRALSPGTGNSISR